MWSPRRRHRQYFWQTKTTFGQDNLYYMFPFKMVVVGALPAQYLGRGPGPLYIEALGLSPNNEREGRQQLAILKGNI